MRICARRYDAPILEISDGIHRAIMKAKNLLSRVAGQRPANSRRVEAAGDRMSPVGRNCQRLHRATVAAQLGMRRCNYGQT